jgi:hypothetical protein
MLNEFDSSADVGEEELEGSRKDIDDVVERELDDTEMASIRQRGRESKLDVTVSVSNSFWPSIVCVTRSNRWYR